jgi:serine/threonine protein phosphatase 1
VPRPELGPSTIYAIGDIHGSDGLFAALLDAISFDADRAGGPAQIVLLGDMVNRGPSTRAVIDRVLAGPPRPCDRFLALRGNHEQALLDALSSEGDVTFRRWLEKGGAESLQSYGLSRREATPARAAEAIGERHLQFLAGLPFCHLQGGKLFVHAGVMSGIPLEDQLPSTLMTVREPFFRQPHGLPFTVVHGHTPTEGRPVIRPGRINVDTGAVTSGILTAAVFEPAAETVRFIQTSPRRDARIVTIDPVPVLMPVAPKSSRKRKANSKVRSK